jgi:phospholipid/cholesterol/gamma-HCH transport system permease protein
VAPLIGRRQRWRATLQQMLAIDADALPMAAVMSFCIGYTLALQSAAERRRFGAVQFVVNLVAISFTRELGALITPWR